MTNHKRGSCPRRQTSADSGNHPLHAERVRCGIGCLEVRRASAIAELLAVRNLRRFSTMSNPLVV